MNKLEISRVNIKPYDSHNLIVNRFNCGKRPIDTFIKNKAKKLSGRLEQRVFTAHYDESSNCSGFYSLQLGSDKVAELRGRQKSYIENHTSFPSVHLSFLGVQKEHQRKGLGTILLMDALKRTANISQNAGFYAFTLQSLDDESTAFYESLGFEKYSENSKQPKMLYPLKSILELFP